MELVSSFTAPASDFNDISFKAFNFILPPRDSMWIDFAAVMASVFVGDSNLKTRDKKVNIHVCVSCIKFHIDFYLLQKFSRCLI